MARLVAADRSERAGLIDVADELRRTARRWAHIHRYGQAEVRR